MNDSVLRHRQLVVEGISVHLVEAGDGEKPGLLLLHGWPENWSAFERMMIPLSKDAHVVAIDLPGIGDSLTPPASCDKLTLAKYVHSIVNGLNLRKATLAGHDIGGQIVYAYLHQYPGELQAATIMNVVIPGVDPWFEVKRNPHIWHFAFHAIPDLPEKLVAGKQADYFAFFYDAISADPGAIDKHARKTYAEAYSRPEALRTGFEWYRAFPQDEKDNLSSKGGVVQTPVLYLRGDHETGDIQDYLRGLREGGVHNLQSKVIPESGHFAPDEQPDAVVAALRDFMRLSG